MSVDASSTIFVVLNDHSINVVPGVLWRQCALWVAASRGPAPLWSERCEAVEPYLRRSCRFGLLELRAACHNMLGMLMVRLHTEHRCMDPCSAYACDLRDPHTSPNPVHAGQWDSVAHHIVPPGACVGSKGATKGERAESDISCPDAACVPPSQVSCLRNGFRGQPQA